MDSAFKCCNAVDDLCEELGSRCSTRVQNRLFAVLVAFIVFFCAVIGTTVAAIDPHSTPHLTAAMAHLTRNPANGDRVCTNVAKLLRVYPQPDAFRRAAALYPPTRAREQLRTPVAIPTPAGWCSVAMCLFFTIAATVSYYQVSTTPPGPVDDWFWERPDLPPRAGAVAEVLTDDAPPDSQMCRFCVRPKLPRVSHCRACKACVMRMDHHCVWIGNCVGISNHKFFILFLIYAILGLTTGAAMVVRFSVRAIVGAAVGAPGPPVFLTRPLRILIPMGLWLAIGSTIGMTILLAWQVYLISNNLTGVEYYKLTVAKKPISANRPYNNGLLNNWRHIMGNKIYMWPIPYRPRPSKRD